VQSLDIDDSASKQLIQQLFRYVDRQWIKKASIGPTRLSVRDNTSRTNNAMESFHATILLDVCRPRAWRRTRMSYLPNGHQFRVKSGAAFSCLAFSVAPRQLQCNQVTMNMSVEQLWRVNTSPRFLNVTTTNNTVQSLVKLLYFCSLWYRISTLTRDFVSLDQGDGEKIWSYIQCILSWCVDICRLILTWLAAFLGEEKLLPRIEKVCKTSRDCAMIVARISERNFKLWENGCKVCAHTSAI